AATVGTLPTRRPAIAQAPCCPAHPHRERQRVGPSRPLGVGVDWSTDRGVVAPVSAGLVSRPASLCHWGTCRVHREIVLSAAESVMCTTKNATKLPALRKNPMVALTIDTEVHPPKILLIRGRAELDVVDGIPDEYLQMNGSYQMTPEQRVEWEAEVRSLYDGM